MNKINLEEKIRNLTNLLWISAFGYGGIITKMAMESSRKKRLANLEEKKKLMDYHENLKERINLTLIDLLK